MSDDQCSDLAQAISAHDGSTCISRTLSKLAQNLARLVIQVEYISPNPVSLLSVVRSLSSVS
ncbi:hypothetical protein [Allocoleopsis sp.]|uniref:hypothetical protein n=1 Tax=Allocoleopsis sp. TaxID=3088169 RepID=UPI002FD6DE47